VVLRVLVEVMHQADHRVLVQQEQLVVRVVPAQLRTLVVLLVSIPQVSLK
jgi:hypothetical protein